MRKDFEEAAQAAIAQAQELRERHGEAETIGIASYGSLSSLRAAGIKELSLAEHTARVHYIAHALKQQGFAVEIYQVPQEP